MKRVMIILVTWLFMAGSLFGYKLHLHNAVTWNYAPATPDSILAVCYFHSTANGRIIIDTVAWALTDTITTGVYDSLLTVDSVGQYSVSYFAFIDDKTLMDFDLITTAIEYDLDNILDSLYAILDTLQDGAGGPTVKGNMTSISGDATAADNLEAILDGTGGVELKAKRFEIGGSNGNNQSLYIWNTTGPAVEYLSSAPIDSSQNWGLGIMSLWGPAIYAHSTYRDSTILLNNGSDRGNIVGSISKVDTIDYAADFETLLADLASAHGSGSWESATGFATDSDMQAAIDSLDKLLYEVVTLSMVSGFRYGSKSYSRYHDDADSTEIKFLDSLIARIRAYHVGGSPGDFPDSSAVDSLSE